MSAPLSTKENTPRDLWPGPRGRRDRRMAPRGRAQRSAAASAAAGGQHASSDSARSAVRAVACSVFIGFARTTRLLRFFLRQQSCINTRKRLPDGGDAFSSVAAWPCAPAPCRPPLPLHGGKASASGANAHLDARPPRGFVLPHRGSGPPSDARPCVRVPHRTGAAVDPCPKAPSAASLF